MVTRKHYIGFKRLSGEIWVSEKKYNNMKNDHLEGKISRD